MKVKSSSQLRGGAPVIGLVGCGRWGVNILRELSALGAAVVVVDPRAEGREAARRVGVHSTVESLEALPPVAGLIVATPAATHRAVAESALRLGVPVFLEKPFTLNRADALALAELGRDRLFLMHVWRYHEGVRQLRQLIDSGELGRPTWIRSWRCNWTSPRTDCDPIWTLLPHDLSIFLELLGELPTPRFAQTEFSGDRAVGMLAVLNGACPCSAEVSTRYEGKRRELRVHFENGIATMPTDAPEIEVHAGRPSSEPPRGHTLRGDPVPALRRELAAFLHHLNGGPAPRSGIKDALAINATMLELRRLGGIDHE